MVHYYDIKYPHLQYWYPDGTMCSVPPKLLAALYKKQYGKKPKTFFDCGAATGVIVQLALDYGMDARGIDVRDYDSHMTYTPRFYTKNGKRTRSDRNLVLRDDLFDSGRVQIKSILDCKPVKADLAYCNGVLTYFDEATLSSVLAKFQKVNMLCAIHNTTEDYVAAEKMGDSLGTCQVLKTVKPNDWWIDTFDKNGFDAKFNHWLRGFVAVPRKERED